MSLIETCSDFVPSRPRRAAIAAVIAFAWTVLAEAAPLGQAKPLAQRQSIALARIVPAAPVGPIQQQTILRPRFTLPLLTTPLPLSRLTESTYASHWDGLLRRHITAEGRLLSWVWLKEREPSLDPPEIVSHGLTVGWTQQARFDDGTVGTASISKLYVPWSRLVEGQRYAYGGDENPLLRGGLAMAALSLDYLVSKNPASLKGAVALLGYAERSEFVDSQGVGTGFFLRTRWPGDRSVMYASGDELSGLIYGLFWLNRALQAAPATEQGDAERLRSLTQRLANRLQQFAYFIVPPPELPQELQRGWAGLFPLQWFAEEAFADITGDRHASRAVKAALNAIDPLPMTGSAADDKELVKVLKEIGPEYSAFDRAIALIKLTGIIMYQQGAPIRFKCSALGIPVKSMNVSIDPKYFNLTYMLHMAQIGLQRTSEGRATGGKELSQELRRLTRGTIFADGSQTGFDADRFGLAYISNGIGHTLLSGAFSAVDWLPGTGCSLQDKHVGARQPDDNYYVMAIGQAYDLMLGDSNPYFRTDLPRRISAVQEQFGLRPAMAERRDRFATPLVLQRAGDDVWWPQSFDQQGRESRPGAGGRLLAFHNLEWKVGSGFAWEQQPGNARRPNGGANGDDGVCLRELEAHWREGRDTVREAAGVDYLLPTALLAYRKGGVYEREVRLPRRTATFSPLPVAAWTPARAQASSFDTNCSDVIANLPPSRLSASRPLGSRLAAGEALYPDQFLRSADGAYELILQRDGNLVLYRVYSASSRTALWASNTDKGVMLIMQGDGNLVLYDRSVFGSDHRTPLRAVWASGTDGRPDAHLLVQPDGNLVLYRLGGEVTWASGTNAH